MIRGAIVFAVVFLLHSIAQFYTWAMADGGGAQLAWVVLSAPLFPMLTSLANEYFWPVAIANSLVWAAAAALVAVFAARNSN